MASASYSDGVTGQDKDALERPTLTVRLLWTGGWDSTFRLLTLISEPDCIVQPYYVIDRSRPSLSIELDTIEKIIQVCRVPGRFPGTVLQPIIANKDDISPNSEIEERYKSLFSKKVTLADQYEWLSRYAAEEGLTNLELCITSNCRISSIVENYCGESSKNLRNDVPDDVLMFKYFSFPLARINKNQMKQISSDRGFDDIMNMTWFCQKNSKWPCGSCNSCHAAITGGLAHRIGWRGLLLHATQLIWVEKAIGKTPEWLRAELRKFGVGTIVLNLRQRCRLWLYRQILRSE
jgi:hypothetical protein